MRDSQWVGGNERDHLGVTSTSTSLQHPMLLVTSCNTRSPCKTGSLQSKDIPIAVEDFDRKQHQHLWTYGVVTPVGLQIKANISGIEAPCPGRWLGIWQGTGTADPLQNGGQSASASKGGSTNAPKTRMESIDPVPNAFPLQTGFQGPSPQGRSKEQPFTTD